MAWSRTVFSGPLEVSYNKLFPEKHGVRRRRRQHQTRNIKLFFSSMHHPDSYDWSKCKRFCLYGSLFVAPSLYVWVRFAGRMWPKHDLRTAMTKAMVEQITYGPFASASFFFGMTWLETKRFDLARQEVADKFLPTYKVRWRFYYRNNIMPSRLSWNLLNKAEHFFINNNKYLNLLIIRNLIRIAGWNVCVANSINH